MRRLFLRLVISSALCWSATALAQQPEVISVLDFGAVPGGKVDNLKAFTAAVTAAKPTGRAVYVPAGEWLISSYFPIRQAGSAKSLDSYNGMTVYGEGRKTIIKTATVNGADVFQLNGVSGVVIRDLAVTGVKTNSSSKVHGINGVSITGGGKNIRIERVHAFDLPFVDKGNYVDGSKGFTVQPGSSSNETSDIKFIGVSTDNTAFGFGADIVGPSARVSAGAAPKRIELSGANFRSWYQGIYVSVSSHKGTPYSDPVAGTTNILSIPGFEIDIRDNVVIGAQHGFVGGRMSGVRITNNRFLNEETGAPDKLSWAVKRVPIVAVGAVHCQIEGNVVYYARADDYVHIGGSTIAGGGSPDTFFLSFRANKFSGKSSGGGIKVIDNGGATVRRSIIVGNEFTGVAGVKYDKSLYGVEYLNEIKD